MGVLIRARPQTTTHDARDAIGESPNRFGNTEKGFPDRAQRDEQTPGRAAAAGPPLNPRNLSPVARPRLREGARMSLSFEVAPTPEGGG